MYWGAGIETGLALLVIYLMPKRLNRLEVYATWAVVTALTLVADMAGTMTFKFDDLANPNMSWQGFIFEILFPPACGVIAANFMPSPRIIFVAYSVVVAILSEWIVWMDVQLGFLAYHHLNLVWSGIVYFLGTVYLRWHLHFIRGRTGSTCAGHPR